MLICAICEMISPTRSKREKMAFNVSFNRRISYGIALCPLSTHTGRSQLECYRSLTHEKSSLVALRMGNWIGKNLLAVIGAALIPFALFFIAMSPLGLGFQDRISFLTWLLLVAVAAYPVLYIFCTIRTVQAHRRAVDVGWWGHIPIFYFVSLFAMVFLQGGV